MTLKISTINELKAMAGGKVVELPGWTDDEPFVARLKRPSMQIMAANGQIPNSLVGAASKLFSGGAKAMESVGLVDITKIEMAVAKASLVEPTMEQLEEAGIELTDAQILAIFQYSQHGMAGLEHFRPEPRSLEDNKPIESVSAEAK